MFTSLAKSPDFVAMLPNRPILLGMPVNKFGIPFPIGSLHFIRVG